MKNLIKNLLVRLKTELRETSINAHYVLSR